MRVLRASLLVAAVATPLVAAACGSDDSVFSSGSGTSSSSSGSGGSGGSTTTGTGTGGATTGTSAGGGGAGGSGGSIPAECASASDCDALFGPSPCGQWACNAGQCEASSPGCTDADQDGYGTGAACACAGLDCDDTDDTVLSTGTRSCYSGPAGTDGVGTCQAGTETCTVGAWGPCVGEVIPSGEACNGQDDDCDGQADDALGTFSCGLGACANSVAACTMGAVGACVPLPPAANLDGPTANGIDDDCDGAIDEDAKACIPVAPTGNDLTADGTFLLPFQTVQAAINWAASHNGFKTVCVAAGAVCGTNNAPVTGTYANANAATITMADGVSVLGNYESTTWNRCAAFTTTVLQPKTPEGVTFPAAVQTTTVLDGFRIDRFNSPTTAAITVDGAKGALVSNVAIANAPSVQVSYGVNIVNGGDATITKSRIDAGTGSIESIAVRSVGAKVRITNVCKDLDAFGRCDDFCANNPSLRGRVTPGSGITHAALILDSPGSIIEQSALCAVDGDVGAVIRIGGNATGVVVRSSLVNAFGGAVQSHGIWMEDCNDAAPWIVDNHYIAAAGDTQMTEVDAVRAMGACHPVIDSNVRITGGGEGQASNPNAVHCGANAVQVASQCVVLGNQNVQGSDFGFPPVATGVRCDDGGCMRVANNVITGRGGSVSYGVWLERTSAFVDSNLIRGGCSPTAVGVHADGSAARIQNNAIFGYTGNDCGVGGGQPPLQSVGLQVLAAAGASEIDVHSNDLDGAGTPAACTGRALELDVSASPPASGSGVYRNNILRAGVCGTARYGLIEAVAGADPRVFENNDLDPTGMPTALYFDELVTPITTAAQVNALADMTVSGVISADPLYTAYPGDLHLTAGSPCVGAGTAVGAPAKDFEGDPRDPATPDIGADEN